MYTIDAVNNKGADQTERMRKLICTFVVRIWHKHVSHDVAHIICRVRRDGEMELNYGDLLG